MTRVIDDSQPYRLIRPERMTTGAVFASPHSGAEYPAQMVAQSLLDLPRLRSSEDAFVDDLLATAPAEGAPLLAARFPRAWVDLNRAEDELDPALIEGIARPARSPRVMAGLGVIPRVVSGGRSIYGSKIPRSEAESRLAGIWRPYHRTLAALMGEARTGFGEAILFDMHSMPSEAVDHVAGQHPDIILGDRFGASSRADVTAATEAVFTGLGLRVVRNSPFAGAYTAQRYGRPGEGLNVLQIEINRALYMDEGQIIRLPDFADFAALMAQAVAGLAAIGRDDARVAAQ